MSTKYTKGYGSELYMSATPTGTTYNNFGQSIDLKGPEPEVGDIKLTNNDSPNDTHEYAPGMIEPGTMDFEMIYQPSEAALFYASFGDGNIYKFAEIFADGSGYLFNGYLKKFGTETKTEDEANKNSVTIKLTSKPVYFQTSTVTGSDGTYTITPGAS